MRLVPDTFFAPERHETPDFVIRKLCFDDAELDFEAVMSSIDIIRQTRGGEWPEADMTLKYNQIDLAWHQREFEYGGSFAYVVFSPEEKEYIGCFYFYPPGKRGEVSKDADVDVSFWVTQKAYDLGLYRTLYTTIQEFLKQWPFEKVVFTNALIPR